MVSTVPSAYRSTRIAHSIGRPKNAGIIPFGSTPPRQPMPTAIPNTFVPGESSIGVRISVVYATSRV